MPALVDLADTRTKTDAVRQQHKDLQRAQADISLYMNIPGQIGLTRRGRASQLDCPKGAFQERNNVSSTGSLTLPTWHYLAKWIVSIPNDPDACKNVVIRVDKYGGLWRWTGLMHHWIKEEIDGVPYITAYFNDDLQYLQFTIAPPNPALPFDIFQWPRDYFLFSPACWGASVTLLMNVARQELNLWQFPDDPFDPAQYGEALDTSTWQVHVKCPSFLEDSSLWAVFVSRMNSIDSVISDALDDAQLSIRYRRIFTDEGETVTGLLNNNVANGSLVFEIVDRSGFATADGTYLTGNAAAGFARSIVEWSTDFLNDNLSLVTDDESLTPDEYWQSGWMQTLAAKPGIVVRDSVYNPLQSKVTYTEATASQVVVGGDNPAADALVQTIISAVGNLLGYFLLAGFDSAGDIASDLIMPFLVGTIAAWDQFKNGQRASNLGWAHLWEVVQGGANMNAWSLSALAVARGGMSDTGAQTAHTLVIDDGTWLIPGLHYQIGDRVGSFDGELRKMGLNLMFVNRVEENDFTWDETGKWQWQSKIGQNKASMTRGEREAQMWKRAMDAISDIGVHLIQ
ncbi:hypothetical protein OS122_02490 [Mycolicibacterium mucogenicum]|uniref:Gp37-like protein n=1 Tax=Mycolicibacterium mucogenicum TaxID=56689 RepID=UPI00226983A1|nr:hypothetical protein [Mycolicibacterium mucogenicum]MCX8559767.1 hypothetical protein [Mycolicibacterium mucogenicum]